MEYLSTSISPVLAARRDTRPPPPGVGGGMLSNEMLTPAGRREKRVRMHWKLRIREWIPENHVFTPPANFYSPLFLYFRGYDRENEP